MTLTTAVRGPDQFAAVGWAGDGEKVHDHVVKQPAETVLSREEQRIEVWAERDDGTRRGSEMAAHSDRPLGLEAHVLVDDAEASREIIALSTSLLQTLTE